jgi:hypothetical protein
MELREMEKKKQTKRKPGVAIPWEEKAKELGEIPGDKQLVQKIWEDLDTLAYIYVWQCLVSF